MDLNEHMCAAFRANYPDAQARRRALPAQRCSRVRVKGIGNLNEQTCDTFCPTTQTRRRARPPRQRSTQRRGRVRVKGLEDCTTRHRHACMPACAVRSSARVD